MNQAATRICVILLKEIVTHLVLQNFYCLPDMLGIDKANLGCVQSKIDVVTWRTFLEHHGKIRDYEYQHSQTQI